MDKEFKTVVKDLEKTFGAEAGEFRGQVSLMVEAGKIVEAIQRLKEKHEFTMLSTLTAVDYWPELEPRFHVIYELNSYAKKVRLEVRAPLDGNEPAIDSVVELFPNANWYEREIWDMFGIKVNNHPDHRRILMPHDWEGHPLRKDYPLGYEEVQFTFNYEEIESRKPRPKD